MTRNAHEYDTAGVAIWRAIAATYGIDANGQVTPIYWIADALRLAAAGVDPVRALPEHMRPGAAPPKPRTAHTVCEE
jgi:hypothetical protein